MAGNSHTITATTRPCKQCGLSTGILRLYFVQADVAICFGCIESADRIDIDALKREMRGGSNLHRNA